LKALLSTGFKMPNKNIMISCQASLQEEMTHAVWQLHELGYHIYATKNTAEVLKKNRVPCTVVSYPTEHGIDTENPNVMDLIKGNEIGLVINIPTHESTRLEDNFQMRRTAVDFGVPLLTNVQLVKTFADAVYKHKESPMMGLESHSLFEHYNQETDEDAWTDPTEFH
jgi:carbamoyl-phosphate synthase (ammonia)